MCEGTFSFQRGGPHAGACRRPIAWSGGGLGVTGLEGRSGAPAGPVARPWHRGPPVQTSQQPGYSEARRYAATATASTAWSALRLTDKHWGEQEGQACLSGEFGLCLRTTSGAPRLSPEAPQFGRVVPGRPSARGTGGVSPGPKVPNRGASAQKRSGAHHIHPVASGSRLRHRLHVLHPARAAVSVSPERAQGENGETVFGHAQRTRVLGLFRCLACIPGRGLLQARPRPPRELGGIPAERSGLARPCPR